MYLDYQWWASFTIGGESETNLNSAYAHTMTDKLKNGTSTPRTQKCPVHTSLQKQIFVLKFHFYAQLDNILSTLRRMAGLTVRMKLHL